MLDKLRRIHANYQCSVVLWEPLANIFLIKISCSFSTKRINKIASFVNSKFWHSTGMRKGKARTVVKSTGEPIRLDIARVACEELLLSAM